MPFVFTSRADGDLRGAPGLATVRQVHGGDVVVVGSEGEHGEADAIVTTTPGLRIAIRVADCAPVVLEADGAIAVVHAGWRGLAAGVIPNALAALRDVGATNVEATLGPCIHADCYEFGADDLDRVAARLGESVRAVTRTGAPALDLRAAVRAALGEVPLVDRSVCTACSTEHWSHRARGDEERQGVIAWI